MGTRGSLTAFGMWPASLFWQRAGPRRSHAISFVPLLLLGVILPGCASVDVLMLSSETFTPQNSQVEILERAPTRPYVKIAVLAVDSWWLSEEEKREKILEKAATLGADAVVFGDLSLSPPPAGNSAAGQSTPPPSLPPNDSEKLIPDDLHPSVQGGMLGGDVRVFLVRGGGHGGGRGGGRGHGGHWGNRSGHSGFRHGGRFFGPGYWGSSVRTRMVGVWAVLGRLLSFLWELSISRLWIHEYRHVRNRDSLHQLNLALLLCTTSYALGLGKGMVSGIVSRRVAGPSYRLYLRCASPIHALRMVRPRRLRATLSRKRKAHGLRSGHPEMQAMVNIRRKVN